MRAVILAAGRGTRMAAVSHGRPKCLLEFGRQTILDYQIGALVRAGITEIAIVVGYEKEQIVQHVAHRHLDTPADISFVVNKDYAVTNNLVSLGRARQWVGAQGFVCLNADVLFHPGILTSSLRASAEVSVAVDPEYREETSKVIIRDGQVIAISKSISRQQCSGTFANITTASRRGAHKLFETIEAMVAEGLVDRFFNDAIIRLGAAGEFLGFTNTGGLPWAEVDDEQDLAFARSEVYPHLRDAFETGESSLVRNYAGLPESAYPS